MRRNLVLNNVEPANLSFRHPLGINLDLLLTMKYQDGSLVDPALNQLVLLPRSRGGAYPYDMEVYDPTNGIGRVKVPGTSLTDPLGYNLEVYSREANQVEGDPPLPSALLARGVIVTEGSAYNQEGPMNMINVPVVTGPPGPQGETGMRGSMWFTGNGDPTLGGVIEGDMYLDNLNGNVWRYTDGVWVVGVF